MFFNELSLSPPLSNLTEARRCKDEFIRLLSVAKKAGLTILRVHEGFREDFLHPWYNSSLDGRDKNDLLDLKRYLTSLATKSPFLDKDSDITCWKDMDCFYCSQSNGKNKEQALGLKAAYVKNGLAVSIPSSNDWQSNWITCEIQEFLNDDIDSQIQEIRHASQDLHLACHASWLEDNKKDLIKSGKNLWERVSDFFPRLEFCADVERQMQRFSGSSLKSIQKGLEALNDYSEQWKSGSFNPNLIDCVVSPESSSTLGKFSSEREFLCPDGTKRCFSWHVKIGDWRIHFHYDEHSPGNMLIGYVGKHLRTVRFPN